MDSYQDPRENPLDVAFLFKENVLHRLGRGAQGTVFLVEHKVTKKKFVLKKIECSDEAQANRAFKEAVALQKLNHPYICGYGEFFVLWDQQDHAIFVCIVMDYYHLGDLDRVLKQRRDKKTPLEDHVMKKWIGQLIEALHYVHGQDMIHRDLKPSNIFLKDDMSITIGDFGVATVMGNVRTVTRTTVGTMSWMAPEVLDVNSHYDERTDIWSLGCIILEMATCGFMDSGQVSAVLMQLKDNPEVLEEVLTSLTTRYSPELSQLIRMSLRRSFQQRPSSKELIDLPYVQECLGLSSSHLYKGKKEGVCGGSVKPSHSFGGLDGVLQYMEDNSTNESGLIEGLTALQQITSKQDQAFDDKVKRRVISAMRDFPSSLELQVVACQVLGNMAVVVSEGDVMFSKEFIQPVCKAMRAHSSSVELQKSACSLITSLSVDEGAASCLGQEGGIQDILAAMRLFATSLEIVSNCCTALWSLSVIDVNLGILTKEKGVVDVCKALLTHGLNSDLVDSACSALWSLSMEDDNLSIMADYGVVDLLLEAINTFDKNAGIIKFGCATLSSLVEGQEVSAYHVVHTEGGVDGVPILIRALGLHSTNPDVTETIASLFEDMAGYDEVRKELLSLKVVDKLVEVQKNFSPNEDAEVTLALSNALASLRNGSGASETKGATSAKLRAK